MPFPLEKLEVYKRSLDLVEEIEILNQNLKGKVSFSLLDQLNIAEGQGRWRPKDKKQFYWISRGSVFEVVPLIQVLKRRGLLTDTDYEKLYSNLESIAKMLTSLIKSVEDLKRN